MTHPAATMLLKANFDIHQIGETLEWSFTRADHDGNPIVGPYAGGIYFTIGEEMNVRLTAGSSTPLRSFTVLDCTLITRPALIEIGHGKPFKYAAPSPFVDGKKVMGASVNLPGNQFQPWDVAPSPIEPITTPYHRLAVQYDRPLTVGQSTGRWEISFVVTVEVDVDGKKVQRVFCFDPEGEVGTTVSPPK